MENSTLFKLGIGLSDPWRIKSLDLEDRGENRGILHIHIGYENGSKFRYEEEEYSVYDHQERTWQHLNFFEHKCYLHARVPRVKTKEGKVKLVPVPWAEKGSSFTLKFEEDVLSLISSNMTATAVGNRKEIGSKTVFRIVRKRVSYALATQQLEPVKELSVDETSSKKGDNYLTIMADRDRKKVVGIGIGKDKNAFADSLVDLEVRGGDRHEVKSITMDMSKSYIASAQEKMPQAAIVFDRFHISKKLNEAVDKIRRLDQKEYSELKNSRYLWLKNQNTLNEKELTTLNLLKDTYQNIGKVYQLKEQFREVFKEAAYSSKLTPLNNWMKIAWNSQLDPLQKFVNMLRRHWYGIKTYFTKQKTNAYAERVNLKIQEIKRLAKGYRNINNFIIMIYFHLGGLNLKPTIFD